jgi:cytochrome c-type biogenesis protein CcmH
MQISSIVLSFLILVSPALAVNPTEILNDPLLESRAREISKGLRCVVCQNQSIDDSDASLARDLRRVVRERLMAGDSDKEIINYVVSRYGDFVLLKPPFKGATLVLWLSPLIFVLLALLALYTFFRRQNQAGPKTKFNNSLSDDERNLLGDLLKKDGL